MPDPASTSGTPKPGAQTGTLTICDEVKKKFPEVIELILGSESMNNEERQYWVNILPIMTPDQLKNLQEILVNERDQLKAIDAKYSKEVQQIGQEQFVRQMQTDRRKKRDERATAQKTVLTEEEQHAAEVLKQIEAP